jgi:hypothetical protein
LNESAAIFCRQVAAWVQDSFSNFYAVKNHNIAKNSTTANASEKISTDLESLEFYNFLMYVSPNQILVTKISHRFLLTTKLFSG